MESNASEHHGSLSVHLRRADFHFKILFDEHVKHVWQHHTYWWDWTLRFLKGAIFFSRRAKVLHHHILPSLSHDNTGSYRNIFIKLEYKIQNMMVINCWLDTIICRISGQGLINSLGGLGQKYTVGPRWPHSSRFSHSLWTPYVLHPFQTCTLSHIYHVNSLLRKSPDGNLTRSDRVTFPWHFKHDTSLSWILSDYCKA